MKRRTVTYAAALSALAVGLNALGARIDVPGDKPSIAEAVNVAWHGDEIVVAPGYWEGCELYYNIALTIRSQNPKDPDVVLNTVIDTPFTVYESPRTRFVGFTFTANLYSSDARLTVENCSFDGAGLSIHDPFDIEVTNCVFTNGDNIGVWNAGAISLVSGYGGTLQLTDCVFYQNRGWNVVDIDAYITPVIRRCTFLGNAPVASALAIVCDAPIPTPIILEGCVISGNRGRGVEVFSYTDIILERCEITGNASLGDGGGEREFLSTTGSVELRGCHIQANTAAGTGGGVAGDFMATGGITTICGNTPDQVSGTTTGVLRLADSCPPPSFVRRLPDLNGDGKVGWCDLTILLNAWGM